MRASMRVKMVFPWDHDMLRTEMIKIKKVLTTDISHVIIFNKYCK